MQRSVRATRPNRQKKKTSVQLQSPKAGGAPCSREESKEQRGRRRSSRVTPHRPV